MVITLLPVAQPLTQPLDRPEAGGLRRLPVALVHAGVRVGRAHARSGPRVPQPAAPAAAAAAL